jgi:hypothetical protein
LYILTREEDNFHETENVTDDDVRSELEYGCSQGFQRR